MALFESAVPLRCDQESVFDFLVRPANVHRILPADSGMTFLDVPEVLELGSRFQFQVAGFGPLLKAEHEITEFDAPHRLVATQRQGPLRVWIHEQVVQPDGSQTVMLIDRVTFEPPGGLAGFLVTEERIRGWLQKGFEHRHRKMKELLEQGTA